ncbi:MAG: GNAT family N-acetyltransferase [Gammaproteobacteria bacterium]|nr:GNAT family N-acetyltransferase [Gammaproteobacteria bacterium]
MTISVDPISVDDRDQWELLYYGYAEFYRVPMTEEILDTVWGWIHDSANPFFGLIAKDDNGRALGLMHCRQMPSPLRGALVGFLDDLFISPDARGQGIVEELYRALNALGKAQGWPFIRWITAENNYRGRAVYDKLSEKTHWITYQMSIS